MKAPIKEGANYGRRDFCLPYCWMDEIMLLWVTTSYSDFGEVDVFREGTLEQKSAHLHQLAFLLYCIAPLQLGGPWGRRVPKE